MKTATPSTISLDHAKLHSALAALQTAFDSVFDIWIEDQDAWYHCSELHGLVDASPPNEVRDLVRRTSSQREPLIERALNGASTLLAIPLPRQMRRRPVAVATFEVLEPEWLLRLGRSACHRIQLESEIAGVRSENDAFLRQVTNDFEELTFLRSMAELLEISDLSFDFTAMAETVLPTLKPLLEADCLMLVTPRTGDKAAPLTADRVMVTAGATDVAVEICLNVVTTFGEASRTQPVVRNNFRDHPAAEQFPGVASFVLVPVDRGEQTLGWLLAVNRNNERNLNTEAVPWEGSYQEFGTHEATLMTSSAAIISTHARNVELFREREHLLVSMVRALVSAIEAKDEYTRGHSERVALYGRRLAEELGFNEEFCEKLYLTGLLHDVGKIGVRDAVLRKPGPLTDDEFEEIKQHPDMGWAILHDLKPLRYVLEGVLYHHENFDGRGYPDRLEAANIPLEGRLLAVADAYDAMTSDRPYRAGMPQEKAEQILRSGAGRQWDPAMLDAFFTAMPDILRIKESYRPRKSPTRVPGTIERQVDA